MLDNSLFVRERRAGANIATYFVGARGPEYRRDDVSGSVRWYLYDGLGSVLGEVDPNGAITSSRKYDVYGVVRGGTNPGGSSKHKFVGQLGHPSEDETGLIYMAARYLDPTSGRFTSQDPSAQGSNWFAYCSNNPINRVDADGKSWRNPSTPMEYLGAIEFAVGWALGFSLSCAAVLFLGLGQVAAACLACCLACVFFALAFTGINVFGGTMNQFNNQLTGVSGALGGSSGLGGAMIDFAVALEMMTATTAAVKACQYGFAVVAIMATFVYGMECFGACYSIGKD